MAAITKNEILLESGTNELAIMEFTIADQHFGINIAKVKRIMNYDKVTPMPNSNPFIEGVLKQADDIITVIDLASYMGLPPCENEERNILILTSFNKVDSAFHVHSIVGMHRISWKNIEKPDPAIYGGEEGLATGIARLEDRLITLVDFEKILIDINPRVGIQMNEITKMGARPTTNKPILVAEDSPLLEKLILEALEKSGYINVTVCSNGEEAWNKLVEHKNSGNPLQEEVCCLITDIEMPKMDGHHLIKLVKEDSFLSPLPIIIFSSLIDEQMKLKGESLGATAQISKPEIGNLVHLVDRYGL